MKRPLLLIFSCLIFTSTFFACAHPSTTAAGLLSGASAVDPIEEMKYENEYETKKKERDKESAEFDRFYKKEKESLK